MPVFFVLSDDYNPNVAPEILICLNKVGKNIGLYIGKNWFVEIVIGKANIHFYGMLDLGTQCKKNEPLRKFRFVMPNLKLRPKMVGPYLWLSVFFELSWVSDSDVKHFLQESVEQRILIWSLTGC